MISTLKAARHGEEAAFILDTLAGKLPMDAFEGPADGPWACFARYCRMQADAADRDGCAQLAGVMRAAGNRAARKARQVAS